MRYPGDSEIVDPSAKLPPEVAATIAEYVKEAQQRYRRFRQRFRKDLSILREEPGILADHAAEVFRTLAALALTTHPGDFEAFRRTIGWEGGAAEIAVWYAHYLYKDVRGGRMPFTWQWEEVEPRFRNLIEDAEDLWHNPAIVPDGWEAFLGGRTASSLTARAGASAPAPDTPDTSRRWQPGGPAPAGEDAAPERSAPASFFEQFRVKNPTMSYDQIAGRIGISRDSLFAIKEEKRWVRDEAYKYAAQLLGCRPEDLHPRGLAKAPRRPRT